MKAQELIDDPVVQAIFGLMRDTLLNSYAALNPKEVEQMQLISLRLEAINWFKSQLESCIEVKQEQNEW